MSDTDLLPPRPTDLALELQTLAARVPAPSLGAARRGVRRRLSRLCWRRRTRNVLGNGALVATVITGGSRVGSLSGGDAAAEAAPSPPPPPVGPMPTTPSAPTPVEVVEAPGAPGAPDIEHWESFSFDAAGGRDQAMADPAAFWEDGVTHVYATTMGPYWVPRFEATTPQPPGVLQGDAMPERPAWVSANDRVIWAPAVTRVGDSYVMYFAATAGSGRHRGLKCIGVAVATSPSGLFEPQASPLTCRDGFWSIDPYVVADGGDLFLLWRQDAPGHKTGRIVAAPLSADGLALAGDPRVLLSGQSAWEDGYPRDSGGIGPIENPAMARHPVTGEWLLTWSANLWETADYATGLATCAGPLGPCERVSDDAPWLRTSWDAAVETSADFVGSGGLSFFDGPDGRLYAVLHAYRPDAADGAGGDPRTGWVFVVESGPDGYVLREFS